MLVDETETTGVDVGDEVKGMANDTLVGDLIGDGVSVGDLDGDLVGCFAGTVVGAFDF